MRDFFSSLWDSQTAFVRLLRSALMGFGAFQSAVSAGAPPESAAMGAGAVALGGLLGAGEKNKTEGGE